MTKNKELAANTAKKLRGKPFKTGIDERRNSKGRIKGSRNFSTLFDEAIKRIAKERKIKLDDAEVDLVVRAYLEARQGNFHYYQDIMDRRYGRAIQPIDVNAEIKNKALEELTKATKAILEKKYDEPTGDVPDQETGREPI